MKGRKQIDSLAQGLRKASAVQYCELGMIWEEADGTLWRYCKAGANALSAGKMGQCTVAVANHIACTPVANVAAGPGSKTFNLTVGNTAVTADQYKDGWMIVTAGTGLGQRYLITANTACAGNGVTTLTIDDNLQVGLALSDTKIDLIPNPWNGVTESNTATEVPAGVPLVAVPANYYYWAQIGGPAACLTYGTPAVGAMLTLSSNTAGALESLSVTIATTVVQPILATMLSTAGVSGSYKSVMLKL